MAGLTRDGRKVPRPRARHLLGELADRFKAEDLPDRTMKPVCIVGPRESGKTTLVERLTTRLSDRGRVATVKHIDCEPDIDTSGKDTHRHRSAGAGETYGIAEDGQWFATGECRSLGETLDELAIRYDYVIVEGYSNADLPTIALGGRDHAGERLRSSLPTGPL